MRGRDLKVLRHLEDSTQRLQSLNIVAPFARDGATDLMTRLLAGELERRLVVPVAIDNQPGEGGTRGAACVARSPADGRTLVMGTSSTHGICASVFRVVPYDFSSDFAPVALVALAPNVLVVGAHSAIATVADLTAKARAKPGELTFGSAGFGQTIHLCGELFSKAAAVDLVHAPRSGSAEALAELAAGGITMMFDSLLSALPYVRRGALRALAVTSAQRIPQLPEIPTLAECGVAGYDVTVWIGLLAPAGTSVPVVARLNAEVNAVLETPAIRTQMEDLGARIAPGSPQDFARLIGVEARKWAQIVARTGVRA